MSVILLVAFLFVVFIIKWQLERAAAGSATMSSACEIASPKLIGMPHEDRVRVLKEILRPDRGQGGLHFHPGHAWVRMESENLVTIGPDEITVKLLGDVEKIDGIKMAGEKIEQGEGGWTLKRGERRVNQASPVSGVVAKVNEEALKIPSGLNRSPYESGWLLKIIPSNLSGDLKNLFAGALADEWLSLTKKRINALFVPPAEFATAQDGGDLVKDIGALITDEQWEKISTELFRRRS